jgi:hypothetical protein
MCTDGDQLPGSAAEALRAVHAGLDYLNGPDAAGLDPAALGGVLTSLGELQAKFTAAHAGFLRRFDAADAHDADGYGTSSAWLGAMTRLKASDARATVAQMRTLGRHPQFADAMAAGEISPSWVNQLDRLTRKLPAELRGETDQILLAAAAAGASLEDLTVLATAAVEQYLAQQPDPDDGDDFDERFVQVQTTFGKASCLRGNLTPECTAAVEAVLESMGKKQGPEDHRTVGQRFHDALQEACELLIRAKMVPARAGADTQVITHIALAELRGMDGASALEEAWIAGRLGGPGFLTGKDAEAAACDAMIIPVVTGHPDMTVIDQIIELVLVAGRHGGHGGATTGDSDATAGPPAAAKPLPAEDLAALRYRIARLAIDFVSGPPGIAALLRTGLLDGPFNTPSLPLDIGYSENIPAHIRRAVALRDQGCAWPRCRRPVAVCDVHHIVHKKDGGKTSVDSCVLLCQFHHDICIHRWGWQIVLNPDGTTEAHGPDGQILRSHAPPTLRAG